MCLWWAAIIHLYKILKQELIGWGLERLILLSVLALVLQACDLMCLIPRLHVFLLEGDIDEIVSQLDDVTKVDEEAGFTRIDQLS